MVRNVLGIADFIVPASWDGIFQRMINFKSIFAKKKAPCIKVVHLRGNNDLAFRDVVPMVDSEEEPDKRFIRYEEISLLRPEPVEQPVVLDIDLDYFCFDNSLSTGMPQKLEITREAYDLFRSQPRHPLRILARWMAFVEQEGDRFYLILREPTPPKRETREIRIRQRVDKFFAWLDENGIQPVIIDICRSRISGYCPADRWELVEQLVLEELRKRFPVQFRDDMLERI